jgi:hypothetical protein
MPPVNVQFKQAIDAKRREILRRIEHVPIAALVWGPNPTSSDPISKVRLELRDKLRAFGHLADFSEDLYDPNSPLSNFAQQISQAEAYDIIFSIPSSFGSIGEIHDFARIPSVSNKIIAFVDQTHTNGYSAQSLMMTQGSSTCRIELYDGSKLPDNIINYALDQVRRLQEIQYASGRRP